MLGMFPDAPALSGLAAKLEAATRALVTAHQAFTEASVARSIPLRLGVRPEVTVLDLVPRVATR